MASAADGGPSPEPEHPAALLEETVHQRVRLGVMALLHSGDRRTFGELRDRLGLTDGTLSRHLTVLDKAGYISVDKGYEGRRPRTWVSLSGDGRAAVAAQVKAMAALMAEFEGGSTRTEPGPDAALAAMFAVGAMFAARSDRSDASPTPISKGPTVYGISDLVLDQHSLLPDFELDRSWSGPINRFYETPFFENPQFILDDPAGTPAPPWSVPPRSAHGISRRALAAYGLRSGYTRTWRGEPIGIRYGSVTVTILELADDDSASSWLDDQFERHAATGIVVARTTDSGVAVENSSSHGTVVVPAPGYDDLEDVTTAATRFDTADFSQHLVDAAFRVGPFACEIVVSGAITPAPTLVDELAQRTIRAQLDHARTTDLTPLSA